MGREDHTTHIKQIESKVDARDSFAYIASLCSLQVRLDTHAEHASVEQYTETPSLVQQQLLLLW